VFRLKLSSPELDANTLELFSPFTKILTVGQKIGRSTLEIARDPNLSRSEKIDIGLMVVKFALRAPVLLLKDEIAYQRIERNRRADPLAQHLAATRVVEPSPVDTLDILVLGNHEMAETVTGSSDVAVASSDEIEPPLLVRAA
jgi:hypothetical protein